jgi:superfamily II DNA or RNA helicase/diadenosine tetraphosphate (Ap4A) HIT family hydrolase
VTCPFCEPEKDRVFHDGPDFLCLWDSFPVSDGHALVVPRRHVATWFEATLEERQNLLHGVDIARRHVEARFRPKGFNIGINVGEVAGQTIPHLHVHLIPRYRGDVYDPRGGVRHVIPDKGNYLAAHSEIKDADSAPDYGAAEAIIFGSQESPLVASLARDIAVASKFDLAVAFVTESGLDQIEPFVVDLLERRGRLRLLTGDYMDVTEPRALLRMLDWVHENESRVEVRVFQTDRELGFHPKAYLIHKDYSGAAAYVGSSNLTKHALTRGLEWNQRIEGALNKAPLVQIQQEFERLFYHPKTTSLAQDWIEAYAKRRKTSRWVAPTQGIDPETERPGEVPTPHLVQTEALDALKASRGRGDKAGLAVMATGLGKTWLAAFDSVTFKRVLFVAHREEILNQAMRTFRRIRPDASLGIYAGGTYDRHTDVLFASIQTLGRQNHLNQFLRDHFDYLVVDEFHHAAAATYRRLIDHFDPSFLLGLTATPERTDGGDLLGLCGENLVFRCDLVAGINRELLCPFRYFGVPDDIDFSDIPWRSGRFDPEKLEFAVATERRAQNAYAQWRKRAQERTLAFCVSKRHADFMSAYFVARGARAVAVHSGPNSAPRTQSLKKLESKELQVIFAVDMFNEGVDVPTIDTVMMLRPTESKILWLQQLGRGLRRAEAKSHLNVIDYIGNHRTFLQVPMLLLPGAGTRPGEVSRALEALEKGDLELPQGCSVEYELEALNILKQLARPTGVADQIAYWYRSFRELHGRRPMATEAWHEGYDPRRLRTSYGSWFGFVKAEGDLDGAASTAFDRNRAFFESLETTQMTKSFKMITLLAMIAEDKFPGAISIDELVSEAGRLATRIHLLRDEFGSALDSRTEMQKLLESNPIKAWTGGKGTGGVQYFDYESEVFSSFEVDSDVAEATRDLARELCDYRLAQYLDRLHGETRFAKSIVCNVSHSNGTPMLFLPARERNPGIPDGWTPIVVEGEEYHANFVKVAVNVVRKPDGTENLLPGLLRSFFGAKAGQPGTSQQVKFEMVDGVYELSMLGSSPPAQQLWKEYMRADIPGLWGLQFNSSKWNQGYVIDGEHMFLLVTLNKQGMATKHQYEDQFLSREVFQWVSQNRTRRNTPSGQKIANHKKDGTHVHLFVRDRGKTPQGKAAPFVHCGDVSFMDWEGDKPITVRWRLEEPLSEVLFARFST